MNIKVAIIDIIGIPYDGTTLIKRGLGGSESAVILMAKELVQLGFDVTVYNNCIDDAKPGNYDGVKYVNVTELPHNNNLKADVMISSRTVIPFVPEEYYSKFEYPAGVFKHMKDNAKLKVLWMHDTFCRGDDILEELVVDGHIDELFTLSDFHTTYVTNCDHGKKRNFEVLKNKIFMTRNGIVRYTKEVDISKKNRNLFVYNAAVTKGMVPLVNEVWPLVKQAIPDAKLKVIGGFYKFKGGEADAQELEWRSMVADPAHAERDVEFTGIIKQSEIAQILSEAGFMIYPAAFPETSGISTLESLAYNTPLITCKFGALEETAMEQACYLIDYAIQPNGLFPLINKTEQVVAFANTVIQAYNNPYLHQQKMYACNIMKDVSEWSTVAMQWKQHIFRKLGEFLPVDEYRKVAYINDKVHRVYGRRFSNKEEWNTLRTNKQNNIVVITPFYNASEYLEKCVKSVAQQDYANYTHYLIDDGSTDESLPVLKSVIEKLPAEIKGKFVVIHNEERNGSAVFNQVQTMSLVSGSDYVMLLDGDDWLVNDNNLFHFYNNIYNEGYEFTYGSCWSVVDNIPLIAQPYPEHVHEHKAYRGYRFNWNMPYTHLRTFKRGLLDGIDHSKFKDENGEWYKAGGDGALFYELIERVKPEKIKVVQEIVYNYNDASPLNDYKVNGAEQTINANKILGNKVNKKILLAIPTAKHIEVETFKSIYDLEVPPGYDVDFQYFYGYNIDQVRNLIASWAERYDYLFSVDSDIVLPKDALVKMLAHDKPIVSGLYIQRKPGQHILELYMPNGQGGVMNIPFELIKDIPLVEIAACGFGCVLVKSEVIRAIGYPQFVYKSALDHKDTVSEDVYFCVKAHEKGFKAYADTTIRCEHVGSTKFVV